MSCCTWDHYYEASSTPIDSCNEAERVQVCNLYSFHSAVSLNCPRCVIAVYSARAGPEPREWTGGKSSAARIADQIP